MTSRIIQADWMNSYKVQNNVNVRNSQNFFYNLSEDHFEIKKHVS